MCAGALGISKQEQKGGWNRPGTCTSHTECSDRATRRIRKHCNTDKISTIPTSAVVGSLWRGAVEFGVIDDLDSAAGELPPSSTSDIWAWAEPDSHDVADGRAGDDILVGRQCWRVRDL